MSVLVSRVHTLDELQSGLKLRGYQCSPIDDENRRLFVRTLNDDFRLELLFSPRGRASTSVGLLIGSRAVTEVMHHLGLFLSDPMIPMNDPTVIISVDLLWLRLNNDPNRARFYHQDYGNGRSGVERVLEDLDTVGNDFVKHASHSRGMCQLLLHLKEYPVHVSWGGPPRSVDPYIYAAILFFSLGDFDRVKETLNEGLHEVEAPEPRLPWQELRLDQYRKRATILSEANNKTNK